MTYTALISGGNQGIGADLAQALLDREYRVISIARNPPKAKHKNLSSIEADLLDPDQVDKAAEALKLENVTHVIHNAGLIWPNLVEDASSSEITGLAQLHLGAALTLTQAVLPQMKAQNFGRILFNSSRAAMGVPTRSAYAATKAGQIALARTWALELAPHGITVNTVAPGPILTENFWGIVPKDSPQQDALADRIPVKRLGQPRDVTNAFLFFCNPENSFVTGQTLYVCGGASIGAMSL